MVTSQRIINPQQNIRVVERVEPFEFEETVFIGMLINNEGLVNGIITKTGTNTKIYRVSEIRIEVVDT